ncbi:MAG: hypothetical protein ACP5DQ_01365 [Bacteroidales bacterium]
MKNKNLTFFNKYKNKYKPQVAPVGFVEFLIIRQAALSGLADYTFTTLKAAAGKIHPLFSTQECVLY